MTDRLIRGKVILSVLGVVLPWIANMTGHMDGTQAGMTIGGVVAAFLHFDDKAAP